MDNRSLKQQLEEEALPSVLSGGIAIAASTMFYGINLNSNIPLFNMQVPAYVAIGGVVGGSVLASELLHDWIIEKIPIQSIKDLGAQEQRVLAPVLAGGSTYLLFKTGVSDKTSVLNSVLLGAGSSIGGKYAASVILNKYV